MILYEDAELIVCRKPAGIPVQTAKIGQRDMESILNNYLGARIIHVVHRLDQPVEGVLVFAKTDRAASALSEQAADGRMKKVYRAVCCVQEEKFSGLSQDSGKTMPDGNRNEERPGEKAGNRSEKQTESNNCHVLVDYLVRDGRTNTSSVTVKGARDAKRAELSYRVMGMKTVRASDAAAPQRTYLLAEIELKTGRHHQIRVQMAHAGLPLYGDQKYNKDWERFFLGPEQIRPDQMNQLDPASRLRQADRPDQINPADPASAPASGFAKNRGQLALCAVSLSFLHPSTKKRMTFETVPEADIFSLF